eukprot:TRINITY_DN38965_c0_g1_i1.p1 TRINITY_DN38965_c0_g1~~TRINITY_DN38965_c0_g1_i1.p1  ORF type:complete len:164 (+),score=49.96 TRINITY_DN38965_c0_g1_i1:156-647(+)
MASKAVATKAGRIIDWDFLFKAIVSDEGKRELGALRRTYDDVSNTIENKLKQNVVAIDWDYYRKRQSPAIVDMFKQSYESVKIPEFEDKVTPEFEKKHAALVAKAVEEEEFSKKEVVRLKAELEKIRVQKDAIKTQTVDEYFALNPEVKEKIDEEIKNQNWGY